MKTQIFSGELNHARLKPLSHSFRYPLYFFSFNLDELVSLDKKTLLFGYNRFNIFSLHDRDYLRGSGSIRIKLLQILLEHGITEVISQVQFITTARYLNYAFNPVSFYYCYRPDGTLCCIVAEVNNTFKERHIYVLDKPDHQGNLTHYEESKAFYVSPFNSVEGSYKFYLSDISEQVTIRVDLHRDDEKVLATQLSGKALSFHSLNLLRTMIKFPLSALLTIPRIAWQAFKLHYKKGMPVITKPEITNTLSFHVAKPNLAQKWCMNLVLNFLSRIQVGCIDIELPNGEHKIYGNSSSHLKVNMKIHNYVFFWKIIKDADIGFGEAYTLGFWECDHLTKLIEVFIENRPFINDRNIRLAWAGRLFNRMGHLLRKNNLLGSRKNIKAHYDLSNDFFQAFLDPSMTYSCALFLKPDEILEQAQKNKIQAMIHKAQISADDHVLEIGSGWGSFCIEAVRLTGCKVTTITLSEQQYELSKRRVQEAGLTERIEVKLCDYRQVEGTYDKIISIEMFEAVGHEYYGTFFQTVDRLLKPDGIVVIQVITIADQLYEQYRRGTDWIQKYIFPGGTVPSLNAITNAITLHSSFVIEKLDNMGIHYARTLREWRRAFKENNQTLDQLGYDEAFKRTWEYYLCYCEAGFNTRTLGTLQFVLSRPNNKKLLQSV